MCNSKKDFYNPGSSSSSRTSGSQTSLHHPQAGNGAVGGNHGVFREATSVNDNDLLLSSLRYHSASLANIASQIQSNQTRHRLSLDNNNDADDPPVMIMMPASALAQHFSNLTNANFVIAFPSINSFNISHLGTESTTNDTTTIRSEIEANSNTRDTVDNKTATVPVTSQSCPSHTSCSSRSCKKCL